MTAFDDALADEVRALLGPAAGITEKRMFGGLAFLLEGNMAVVVRGRGGLMVRLDPTEHEAVSAEPGAEPTLMRGREMRGWVTLPPATCGDHDTVAAWVARALEFTGSLPPK